MSVYYLVLGDDYF
jgi:hypothetical protein